MEEKFIWATGETPGPGYYVCANCQNVDNPAVISDDDDELPVCPFCGGMHWMKPV